MASTHCIITRFSFRFKADDPVHPLLSETRLTERVKLFEQFCYQSIINQDNPKFFWILIIDPLLPEKFKIQLEDLITKHETSKNYAKKGPRKIWLHEWDWSVNRLENLDWVLPYFEERYQKKQKKFNTIDVSENTVDVSENMINVSETAVVPWKPHKYFITTRLDDDDCLVHNFVDLVQNYLRRTPPVSGFRYLSFSVGYYHYTNRQSLRINKLPLIALGLTLIAEIKKYPISAYLGNHTKIATYIKDPTKHPKMLQLHKKNKDMPVSARQISDRLWVIRSGPPVWIRNIHGFNLQKNVGNYKHKGKSQDKVKEVMGERFNVKIK